MKADTKSFVKDIALTTLVLVLIAVIAGGILAVVNKFTYMSPQEILESKLTKVYASDGFSKNLYDKKAIGSTDVFKQGEVLGVYVPNKDKDVVIIHALGKGAYKSTLEIMVVIKDYKIQKIDKYAVNETPGLGSKAFNEKHLKQYVGKDIKDIDKFELTKVNPNGQIDAVTAATKTSTALNNAINVAISYYKTNYDKLVGGAINE